MTVVWSLFDSGKGAYQRTIDKYFSDRLKNYSIGIDKLNENDNFINLNLADYSALFGDNKLFATLDQLPKPDIILASPPCESWSVASALRGGNRCYVWMDGPMSMRRDIDLIENNKKTPFKCYPWKVMYTRVNGELCAYNTIRIIQRYQPKFWVIENPYSSHIWHYLSYYHEFTGIINQAHYGAYSDDFPKKPTGFMSNVPLVLKKMPKGAKSKITVSWHGSDHRKQIRNYNVRSDIPELLVKDILDQLLSKDGSFEQFKL